MSQRRIREGIEWGNINVMVDNRVKLAMQDAAKKEERSLSWLIEKVSIMFLHSNITEKSEWWKELVFNGTNMDRTAGG